MAKTFKEMVIEKVERMTEDVIDDAFRSGYTEIDDKTIIAMKRLKQIEERYNAALKMIDEKF